MLAATLTIAVSSTSYKEWWGKFPVKQFTPMILGSLVGTAVGVYLLSGMSRSEFQLWIGLSVIVATLAAALVRPSNKVSVPQSLTAGTGVASGLMNGAFAIPGPRSVVRHGCHRRPKRSARISYGVFLWSNGLAVVMFTVADMVTATPLLLLLLAFPMSFVGDH